MAFIQYWMNYTIFFQDEAEYQFAIAVAGGSLLELAPRDAAAIFGIPFPYPSGDMASIPKGINFYFPFTPGSEFRFPNPSGIFVNDTVLTTTVPGQAGNPPSIWPAGPDGRFTWSGNIVRSGGAAVEGEPVPTAIPQRRWLAGRELSSFFEGGSSLAVDDMSRDFSRTIDGHGWGIRGNNAVNTWFHTVDEFRTGLITNVSRERFYFRVRRFPTLFDIGLWRCRGFPSDAAGFGLKLMVAGTVDGFNISAVSTEQAAGTVFTPVIDEWNRVDILLKYNSGAGDGIIQIYINGVFVFAFTDSTGFGLDSNTRHTRSEVGEWNGVAELECEVDFDDWICSDLPANCDPVTLNFIDGNFPIDWILGSHVRSHFTDVASQVNWAPAGIGKGVQNQNPSPETRLGTSELVSSTSGAILEGLTDALPLDVSDVFAIIIGAASAIISLWSRVVGATDGQLGYRLAGAAATLVSINQAASDTRNSVMYLPTGMILPVEISPWSTVHTKSVDANADTTTMMISAVEYIGIWGPEDEPTFQLPISRKTFIHNGRYGNTPYGYFGSQPDAPCFSVGGTYVGNGTYQEIILPTACHFLLIRQTITGTSGIRFLGAALGAHLGGTDRTIPNVRMWYDFLTNEFKFSVVGGVGSVVNVSGTTYQYIAFCDPGMRFSLCGAFGHGFTTSTPKENPLIESGFLPEVCFFQRELIGTVSNAAGMFIRGPGHTANQGYNVVNGIQDSNIANFATGIINSFSSLHINPQATYMAFRSADSGGVCTGTMIQALSYVGNGVNPRNITLTPTSGRFPLLVMVFPTSASGTGFMRDPSHTGANSSNLDTNSFSTTAITAVAIDQITVNSTLNVNGVTYSVFVICGGVTNVNGEFFATYCDGGGPYIPPNPPAEIAVLGNGGFSFNGLVPFTILKDVTGIYTLVPGKTNDTLYDRQTGQTSVNKPILPKAKTGYIGG